MEMGKLRILYVAMFAVFAFGVVATSASAETLCVPNVKGLFELQLSATECAGELLTNDSPWELITFLLAEWLLEGNPIVTPDLVESPGELTLTSLNGAKLGVVAEILCTGILVGTVGPESADLITEVLTLGGVAVSSTPLVGQQAECTNTKNCESPKVWPVLLPWVTELELLEEDGGPFFINLLLAAGWYAECTILGVKSAEECTGESAILTTNEAGGVVGSLFSEEVRELAGLKLGNCSAGGVETGHVIGSGTIKPVGGGSLTASSGP